MNIDLTKSQTKLLLSALDALVTDARKESYYTMSLETLRENDELIKAAGELSALLSHIEGD
jgi:hypothetical protein